MEREKEGAGPTFAGRAEEEESAYLAEKEQQGRGKKTQESSVS